MPPIDSEGTWSWRQAQVTKKMTNAGTMAHIIDMMVIMVIMVMAVAALITQNTIKIEITIMMIVLIMLPPIIL